MKNILPTLLSVIAVIAASSTAQTVRPDAYKQLKFRYIGPVGNRISAVAGVAGDPWVYYAGSASGGIFKTTDGGPPGRRSLTVSSYLPSGRWRWRPLTRMSFGRAPVSRGFAVIFRSAWGFTNPPTRVGPG